MKKVIIIGGGITGLSTAWRLSENNFEVNILESDKFIGGLAKTVDIGNYKVDLGPHSFLSEDKEIFNKVMGLFEGEKSEIPFSKRKVKMVFKGKYVDYPLSVKSVLFQMGFFAPILSSLSFAKSYIGESISSVLYGKKEDHNKTVEEWAIGNFGKYLYENFFKLYTEQFWKIKTSELSHKVIPSSVKMNFAKTLKHLLIKNYLHLSRREPTNLSLVQRESLPSFYPKKGFGEIAKRMGKKILDKGGKIHINQEVKKIVINSKNSFDVETNDKTFSSDYVVSTIPLNKVISKIHPVPKDEIINSAKKLEYLCLIIVYLIVKKKDVLGCQYVYFLDRPYNRIFEMNSFSEHTSPKEENIIGLEISSHFGEEIWNATNEEIFETCMKGIAKDSFLKLKREDIVDYKIIKTPSVYPIYRKDYDIHLKKTQNCFSNIESFFSIGRQGQFYYGDIDQMIRVGFDTASKIINKK